MRSRLIAIVAVVSAVVCANAQTGLTPAQIAYLNQLFLSAKEDSIPGLWLVDNSVTSDKLAPSLRSMIESPESDPVFSTSLAKSITITDIAKWDLAYTWGNHATSGYITDFTELDPVYTSSVAARGDLFTGTITSAFWTGSAWGTNFTYYLSGLVVSNVQGTP